MTIRGILSACLIGACAGPGLAADMRLRVTNEYVEFACAEGAVAGRYNYTDPYKPYVHPLLSPKGYCVTLVSPHDHKHHKGLMYGLRTPELSFFEEEPMHAGDAIGRERHLGFSELAQTGAEVGFTESLVWEPIAGGEALFGETRRITCRRVGAGFQWTWDVTLTARRSTRLIQSHWSRKLPDGRSISYHGLGIRLQREFGGETRNNALQLDDGPVRWNRGARRFDFSTAMGTTPAKVTYIGSIDGVWPTPQVAVTLAQHHQYGLFVMDVPIAYLSFGPSNLGERPLKAGESLHEHYTVTIADVPVAAPPSVSKK